MGVLKTAGIVAALAVGGVLIAAATEKIFPLVDDLHRFNTWNPFEKKDPNLKGSYRGAPSGKGAAYAFDGNKNVGKGTIEIVDSAPASRVTMTLHMLAPFETRNTVRFLLEPQGELTRVTWAMQGHVPYLAKIIHLFIDMDRMVGSEFEAGLASLKAIAEKTP